MTERTRKRTIYTIGHSTHPMDDFIALLTRHGIAAVADVRSVPYSRWQPQFNRPGLRSALKEHGISYVFLGEELGGRSDDPQCRVNGRVDYRKLAGTPLFRSGIERLLHGCCRMAIALMCAEKDPIECHRAILVGRELVAAGADVVHVLADGRTETHGRAMRRLAATLKLPELDLLLTREDLEDRAYAMQERRIGFDFDKHDNEAQEERR